ncbi:NAD(P)/FAD-dependent oxidoreductase [Dactylosporangium sp. CA-139114]|uniref:NAD(P)/FAD-dependent oxidoreductase n=1 Tax=Dactylosporangium sp. CA-139114 TaxID=3239931 RepID=UPI003D9935C6
MSEHVRVAIVGGGPAGLAAAAVLAGRVDGTVLVLERETAPGGIARHSAHSGYGIRDLHRVLSGPSYADRLAGRAAAAGAVLETEAMVTGWAGDRALEVTSPRGRRTVTADAIVLATGARERPRPARGIPGDRPAGVYTTGQLQQLVHLHHRAVGRRAVVVGAELVSWSAVLTLRAAGCRTVLLTTELARPELRLPLRPVRTRTRLAAIHGHGRVSTVELEDLRTGRREHVACDTVVLTGDWIPDHELARAAGLAIDPATLGPRVDAALRTSRHGVFAAGNLLHPVDTADVAALDGRHVAAAVLRHLAGAGRPGSAGVERPGSPGVELVAEPPLRWVAPQLIHPGGPPPARDRLLLWTTEHRRLPRVTATQDGRRLGSRRLPWPAAPGRVFRVPYALVRPADPTGGPVHLTLGD